VFLNYLRKPRFLFGANQTQIDGYCDQSLPIPPPLELLGNGFKYIENGKKTAGMLKTILEERNITLDSTSTVLDWGCGMGRVIRHFIQEAKTCEFWGVDQSEQYISWAKENLSPPFHFVTCTEYPHLPFQDEKFTFLYGISVFTHFYRLYDMWLMELNRVLKKGGLAVFTIHDEHTVQYFREYGRPSGMIPAQIDLSKILQHDFFIILGKTWNQTFTFFKTQWIRKEWGRYFEVVDIKPLAEVYQTAVVLRKT